MVLNTYCRLKAQDYCCVLLHLKCIPSHHDKKSSTINIENYAEMRTCLLITRPKLSNVATTTIEI